METTYSLVCILLLHSIAIAKDDARGLKMGAVCVHVHMKTFHPSQQPFIALCVYITTHANNVHVEPTQVMHTMVLEEGKV